MPVPMHHFPAIQALREAFEAKGIRACGVSLVGIRISLVGRKKSRRVTAVLPEPRRAKGAIIADGIQIHLPLKTKSAPLLAAFRKAVQAQGEHFGVHWHSERFSQKKGSGGSRSARLRHSIILYSSQLPLVDVSQNDLRRFQRHLAS